MPVNPITRGGSLSFQCWRDLHYFYEPNVDWKITSYSGDFENPSLWYGSANNPRGWKVVVISADITGSSGGVVQVYAPLTASLGISPEYKVWAKTPFAYGGFPPFAWIYNDFGVIGPDVGAPPGPPRTQFCTHSTS